jgi:activator of HSP90 ATPase
MPQITRIDREENMRELAIQPSLPGRRKALGAFIGAMGALSGAEGWAGSVQNQGMKEAPSSSANQARTSLHQEIDYKAHAQRIYEILLDAKQFAAFTGMPADMDAKPGGAFSLFSGMIIGRNVELVPNDRIVQAWRPASWEPGIFSIAKFELKPQDSGCKVILDHTGFPEGLYDHLSAGWKSHYWEPLAKYLA